MIGPNFRVRHPIYKACLDLMSICSVPSLNNILSYTQQVHKTSKKCLLRASGHLATRQEDVRDTSNGTGWDCAIFPKFLESKCGLREVEGHACVQHLQALYLHLRLHFHHSHMRWMTWLSFHRWGHWRSEKINHSLKVVLTVVST